MKRTIIALAFVLAMPLFGQPTKQWSQGNPTAEEQFALEVINRIRRDPISAANFFIGQEAGKPVLKGGIATNTYRPNGSPVLSPEDSFRAFVQLQTDGYNNSNNNPPRTSPPKEPLALYPLFTEQAQTQNLGAGTAVTFPAFDANDFFNTPGVNLPSKVVAPKVVQQFGFNAFTAPSVSGSNATGGTAVLQAGSTVPGGPSGFGRGQLLFVANYYDPQISLREVFATGSAFSVFFDDSFTSNTTSLTSTTFGKTRMVGISLSAVRNSNPGQGARVLSVFATDQEGLQTSDLPFGSDTVFITGVVYQDNDKDGDYTPGEGLAGVRVTPNKGEWFAVTSASGGYSIPVNRNSGVFTVTVSGGPAGSTLATSNVVTVAGDSVKLDFVRQNTAKPVQVTVDGTTGDNRFSNLSTRGVAESGATALIGGFVIQGDLAVRKRVIIRGVSKSLTNFNLEGVLRKPLLTLYNDKSEPIVTVRTQDTYASGGAVKANLAAAFKSVGAFDFLPSPFEGQPDGIRLAGDVAMVVDLAPGLYSVSITPDADTPSPTFDVPPNTSGVPANSGSSGIVLMEIYDGSNGASGRFVNLSTRGKIETGARQMIVGFVVSGTGSRRLLVRGIGPALKGFSLPGALDDSALVLYDDKSQPLLTNDDWGLATWTDQTVGVSQAVGAFTLPDTSRDAVLLARVAPGLYSAGVSSASGQVGIGLAEIYEN